MIYRVVLDGVDILDYEEPRKVLLSPKLDTELNTAGSFEFTMPPDHEQYNAVRPLLSTVEIYEDEDLIWFGRPLEIKTDFWKQRLAYCEGALAFFSDSLQRPHTYDSVSLHTFFADVIASHNAQVSADRQFTVGRISMPDTAVYRKLNYETTFDVLKQQCVGAEGGYLFVRRENGVNYIDWLAELPYTCNQPVEFGLNLLDITSGFDGSSVATCVVPLGDEDLTVTDVNNGSDVIDSDAVSAYGRITKVIRFNGVTDAAILFRHGLDYLQNTQFGDMVIECSAAELHFRNENFGQFRVGQMIRCHSVPHLVDREFPLTKLSLRLDTAAKQITLGSVSRQSLTRIYKEEQQSANSSQNPLTDKLDALKEKVDELKEQVEGIPGIDLSGLEAAIQDVRDELETAVTALRGEIAAAVAGLQNGGDVTQLRSDLTDLSNLVNGIVDGSNDGWAHWFGTEEEYAALTAYDNHTIYYIQSSDNVSNYFILNEGTL